MRIGVPAALDPLPAVEPVDWLEEALALEDQLLEQARRAPGGEVIWLHPNSLEGPGSRLVRLGWDLYDGVTGLALFLGALELLEPRDKRRDCILSALAPLRRQLNERVADPQAAPDLRLNRLGGFTGLGGCIYAFLLLGRWLGEPALITEAATAATLVTPEQIAADEALDVMRGCAGTALALLALDRVSPHGMDGQAPIERAIACGEHLLSRRASVAGEPKAWPAGGLPAQCGFAHGAAGIACCLARLAERTGEARFRQAAEEGIAFEQVHYDPEHRDWPLSRVPGRHFMASWCGGAPGIALGRLDLLALGSAMAWPSFREALETTMESSTPQVDSLCCGTMGRSEILLQACRALGEERLCEAPAAIASRVVLRSRQCGGRYCLPGYGNRFVPFFFTGAAGVGYALLRLARPALLPCVLSLEVTQ